MKEKEPEVDAGPAAKKRRNDFLNEIQSKISANRARHKKCPKILRVC